MNFIFNNALKIFLGLLITVVLFHISILIQIIPYAITWGGRLQNDTEMYAFEAISILINVFLLWVLSMKGGFAKFKFSAKSVNIILWVFFVIFILNTIGNLFSRTLFEKLFSFLTGISAILLWNILKKETTTNR